MDQKEIFRLILVAFVAFLSELLKWLSDTLGDVPAASLAALASFLGD